MIDLRYPREVLFFSLTLVLIRDEEGSPLITKLVVMVNGGIVSKMNLIFLINQLIDIDLLFSFQMKQIILTLAVTCLLLVAVNAASFRDRSGLSSRRISQACYLNDDFHAICYGCGRRYSSTSLFEDCCKETQDVVDFCENIEVFGG